MEQELLEVLGPLDFQAQQDLLVCLVQLDLRVIQALLEHQGLQDHLEIVGSQGLLVLVEIQEHKDRLVLKVTLDHLARRDQVDLPEMLVSLAQQDNLGQLAQLVSLDQKGMLVLKEPLETQDPLELVVT